MKNLFKISVITYSIFLHTIVIASSVSQDDLNDSQATRQPILQVSNPTPHSTITVSATPPPIERGRKVSCLGECLKIDYQFLIITGRFAKGIAGLGIVAQAAISGFAALDHLPSNTKENITIASATVSAGTLLAAGWYEYTERARKEVQREIDLEAQQNLTN